MTLPGSRAERWLAVARNEGRLAARGDGDRTSFETILREWCHLEPSLRGEGGDHLVRAFENAFASETLYQRRPIPGLVVPGDNASSGERVAYLRAFIRPYAQDLAAWHLMNHEDEAGAFEGEVHAAAAGHAEMHGLSASEAAMASEVEWKAALARFNKFATDLRFSLSPLGRRHAPEAQIVTAAHVVNHKHGVVLPEELLLDLAADIIEAALPHARARYGRRF